MDINLEGYPKTGILEIFTDKDVEYPCQYAIRYFDTGKDYKTELPEINVSNYIINEPSKIELIKDSSYMPLNDYRFVKTMKKYMVKKLKIFQILTKYLEIVIGMRNIKILLQIHLFPLVVMQNLHSLIQEKIKYMIKKNAYLSWIHIMVEE